MIECISIEELSIKAEYLTNYFIKNKEIINKQSKRSKMIAKGKEFYALSKIGNYTYGKYAVTFRDNTKLVAAVVKDIITPWGKIKKPICAKHAPYISMVNQEMFITNKNLLF